MQVVERAVLPSDEMTLILGALTALKRGDASVRLPAEWTGVPGKVADAFNEVVELNERMARGARAAVAAWSARKASSSSAASLGDVARLLARLGRLGQLADRRPGAPDAAKRRA